MFTIYNPFSLFLCAFSFCFTENSARIPDVVVQRMCRVYPVNPTLVPSVEDAIQMYADAGGTITLNSLFGVGFIVGHSVFLHSSIDVKQNLHRIIPLSTIFTSTI